MRIETGQFKPSRTVFSISRQLENSLLEISQAEKKIKKGDWLFQSAIIFLDPAFAYAITNADVVFETKPGTFLEISTEIKVSKEYYDGTEYIIPASYHRKMVNSANRLSIGTKSTVLESYELGQVSDDVFTLPYYGIGDFRNIAEADSLFSSWLYWACIALAMISVFGMIYYKKRAL